MVAALDSKRRTGPYRCPHLLTALLALAVIMCGAAAHADEGAIPGYRTYDEWTAGLAELAASPLVDLTSLVQTAAGSDVWLVTLGPAEGAVKPALLVAGSVDARQPLGRELAVRMAEQLVAAAEAGETALLDQATVYIIPDPSPDAGAAFFTAPVAEQQGNTRPTDDDRDFELDEDGPEDLSGDGLITMMRIAQPGGPWRTHPEDPRVMIRADAAANETGQYLLLSEGIDDDEDEQWNEDGPGGVVFNRNFTYNYPYFESGAGPHQVSEPETRAVADFCFDHPEIALVLSFSLEDNLLTPWQHRPGSQRRQIVGSVNPDDAPLYAYLGEQYRELREEAGLGCDAPPPEAGAGSFSEWVYYHYGRWSLASRGWWPQRPEEQPAADDAAVAPENTETEASEPPVDAAEQAEPEDVGDRGKFELIALDWLDTAGIDGFVDWTPVEHPDFPDQLVEVGGFRPYVLLNPPASELDVLAELHVEFLGELAGLLPRLEFADAEIESLGGGLYRLEVTLVNLGYLPTVSAHGDTSRVPYPLRYDLALPAGAEVIGGYPRGELERLSGNGGRLERSWLIRAAGGGAAVLTVGSPSVGQITTALDLASDAGGAQ